MKLVPVDDGVELANTMEGTLESVMVEADMFVLTMGGGPNPFKQLRVVIGMDELKRAGYALTSTAR